MNHRSLAGSLAVAVLLSLLPIQLQAQQVVWSTMGETAGDDVSLLFSEVDLFFSERGFSPFLALSGYRLWVDGPNIWQINPAAGIRHADENGFIAAKGGYAFVDQDDPEPLDDDLVGPSPFFGGGEDGVTTTAIAEYWGAMPWTVQALASGNWGSEFIYTRGHVTRAVAQMDGGSVHLGAEGVWQADLGDDPLVDEFEAHQVGGLLQWKGNGGLSFTGGGGWKGTNVEDTWYGRLGLVVVR